MKKIIALIFAITIMCGILAGCAMTGNRSFIDTTYNCTRGIVYSPNGEKIAEGRIESWHDYDDSDQLQVRIGGKTYLTAAENIVMIAE